MADYIFKDSDGNEFISFEQCDEACLSDCPQLTHCLVIIKLGDDYLLGWNKWRKRYEIFGGCIDHGESARECIIREGREELGIQNREYEYLGLMKFLLKPDWFSREERIEFGGLYGITLTNASIDSIYAQIEDRDEIAKLALYRQIKGKDAIAPIDEKLLEFYL